MSTYFTTSEVAQNPESIFWLEKGQTGKTTMEDIQDALSEYKNNYDAGNASKAEILTLHRAYPDSPTYKQAAVGIQKMDMVDPLVIGGPASVEMIDREGHLITTNALSKAFQKFMDNQRTRNVMVLHSDVQVGWALPAYITKGGQLFKSGVGENGLFFICELRDDTTIAKKVADQIGSGLLKSYSIAGSATKVQNMMKGQTPYMQVDEMELAEVTICEKGVNQGAGFELLKAELPQTGKIDKDQCGYRDATAPEEKMGINCGHCKYFNSETRTCDVVVGDIMPGDYCRLFEAAEEDKPQIQVHRKIIIMRSENTGKINFRDSFLNWMSKEEDPLKSGKSFTTLNNFAGREAEHHRLLQRYGFPSEVDMRTMRYIPVSETETDDDGKPINVKPPWVVNEAGENLGERLDNDDLTKAIDVFEEIIQKATKRMDKANGDAKQAGGIDAPIPKPTPKIPNDAFAGQSPKEAGLGMGVTPATMLGMGDPAGRGVPPQTEQGKRNVSPIDAGEAALMRDYPDKPDLPTSGAYSQWFPSGEASTAAAKTDKAPFPASSPSGIKAQQAADPGRRRQEAYREAAQKWEDSGWGEATRNAEARGRDESEKGIWGKVKNLFRRPRQQEEGSSADIGRTAYANLRDREAQTKSKAQQRVLDRREELQRTGGVQESLGGGQYHATPEGEGLYEFKPAARGRQAGTPVEEQGRGRQSLEGPAIRYRRGEDEPGKNPLQVHRQEAARNRADAAREAREERTGEKEPTPEGIVGAWQSQRRRDRMENLSPREKAHQGMKRLFRGGRQAVRGVDQNIRDLRGEVAGVPKEMGRGFRDEAYGGGEGDEWANRPARAVGRGLRRGAEAAGGAFRGFMKPREDVRPDRPVSDRPASTLGETDTRLGAGSRERGGQVGRMARQWLGRGARAGKGAVQGFLEDPDDARRVGRSRRYEADELGATGRQADVAGMRGRGAGAKLRGFLDEKVGRGQELAGEGADRIPRYGRNAQQQRRMGVTEGVGKDIRYSPTDHQGMSTDQKHNHVQERLDHINQGGNLSPKDWMSMIHHLGQTEDGDRFAQHHSINIKGDDWNKPISFANMRQHLDRNMQVHHGRHGGAGAEAYDSILSRLGDSHEFGREITLKRLRGGRPSMEGLGREQARPEQARPEETGQNAWEEAFGPTRQQQRPRVSREPRVRGRAAVRAKRQAQRAARQPEVSPQHYYAIENAVPVHKIFAKAFGLVGTRR